MEVQFAFAFTAGLVSTVNPCGFAMLPAHLAYFVEADDADTDQGRSAAVLRGLLVGGAASAGFLTVFGVAGLLLGAGIQTIRDVMPWLAMAVAVGVIVLGVALIRGFELSTRLPTVGKANSGRRLRSFYGFGISYAIASLSCVLPIFLIVVTVSLGQGGFVAAAAASLIYGLGMSLLLMTVTLAVALGRQSMIGWLRRSSRHVSRVAGVILILAGGYIVFFWVSVLSSGGLTGNTLIRRFEQVQSGLVNALGEAGTTIGIVLGSVLLAAVGYVTATWLRRRNRPEEVSCDH